MKDLPHTTAEVLQMLKVIGANSVDDLFSSIPAALRAKAPLSVGEPMGEQKLESHLRGLANKNTTLSEKPTFLGAGAYRHFIPAGVSEIASRAEFVTPYTPYQPEISQGTLQVIFEYQSMMTRLFAMDACNASHYSGATALADACLMARRATNRKGIVVIDSVHPEYRAVLSTVIANDADINNVVSKGGCIDKDLLATSITKDTAAVVVQYPNFFGIVEDLKFVASMAHDVKALLIAVVPEPISLGLLTPPGEWGADVAVGEGMSLGLPVSFGGPTLGIMTVKSSLLRQMPGRICGRTVDSDGKRGYVLTLSTREQHIRREKATSNICSNQALCATTASIYLSMLGKSGLRDVAMINASLASYAKRALAATGAVSLPFSAPTFNEFVVECKKPAADVLASLSKDGITGGVDLGKFYKGMEQRLLVCCTEMNSKDEIDRYADTLKKIF